MATGDKVERKYLAHFIDSSFGDATPAYTRLGKDLEEYNIEMNPDIETKNNILGESSNVVKGYEPSSSVDTFYAYEGDPMFTQMAKVINDRLTGTALQTTVVDVLVDATGTVIWAYRENAIVVPQSIGGDGAGVNIPFEIKYNGSRKKGTFDMSTKAFTEATGA
jgi:hypothetical protein